MLPDSKAPVEVKSPKTELDEIGRLIVRITTGGFKIPPKGDPFWNKVQEFNKVLKAVAKG